MVASVSFLFNTYMRGRGFGSVVESLHSGFGPQQGAGGEGIIKRVSVWECMPVGAVARGDQKRASDFFRERELPAVVSLLTWELGIGLGYPRRAASISLTVPITAIASPPPTPIIILVF